MKHILSILFIVASGYSSVHPRLSIEKPIKIAVIDTGYSKPLLTGSVPLCEDGHADTSSGKIELLSEPPRDNNGHGTNVAHIISSFAAEAKHCLIVIRFYSNSQYHQDATHLAIKVAVDMGANIINVSAGGYSEIPSETREVRRALSKGIIFVAAAGNEGVEMKEGGTKFYPALADSRVIVVGSLKKDRKTILSSSNRGEAVDVWEVGEKVSGGGRALTGTSQATAIVTGKITREIANKQKTHRRH